MEILRYFDSEKKRRREFIRYQISRSEKYFVLEILTCKLFSGEVASGELYIEEFKSESDADIAYQNKISYAEGLPPDILIQREIENSE